MQEIENKPLVSVIIPTYNRGYLVGRAIRSVLNQTYQNFEIIIVDDASTDNTREVVESFRDPLIRYIKNEQNQGGGVARNIGIKAVCGEFMAFLDSDDEWLPRNLELQMAALSQAGSAVGFAFCGTRIVSAVSANAIPFFPEASPTVQGDISEQLLMGVPYGCCLCSLVVKLDKMSAMGGFDPLLDSSQDWDFMIRLSQTCHCVSIPQILTVYHKDRDGAITQNLDALIAGRERMLAKYWNLMKHSTRSLRLQYRDLARFCLLAGYREKALQYLIATFKLSSLTAKLMVLPWFALIILKPSVFRRLINLRRYWRSKLSIFYNFTK